MNIFKSSVLTTAFLLTATTLFAALDPPHNASHAMGCDSCHDINSPRAMLMPVHVPNGTGEDNTLLNNLCIGCHNPSGLAAAKPVATTHSSFTSDDDYGNWTVECWVCHSPHSQGQGPDLNYIRTSIGLDWITDPLDPTKKTDRKNVEYDLNSFIGTDGTGEITGICQVCHTETNHFRNDGSFTGIGGHASVSVDGANCMTFCHTHERGFRPEGYVCLDCHTDSINARAAIGQQFNANSHHIQTGTAVTSDQCYTCHWEADATGKMTSYHNGSPNSVVDLLIHDGNDDGVADPRPTTYILNTTAIQYTSDGSRSQIMSLNDHCLGCHNEDTKGEDIFGDGKSPDVYAWDGYSIDFRYSQNGSTTWGKYEFGNSKTSQTKAFSAHGNAAVNQRGWTATESDFWTTMSTTPAAIGFGGDLAYDGNDYIYATRGSLSQTFYRYTISTNTWTTMANTPNTVYFGGTLVYDGGNYIYATRGNNTTSFYRYTISTNTWTTLAVTPGTIYYGGDLAHDGGNYIYATKGGNTTLFYRYSISTNTWTTLAAAPGAIYYGGDLAFDDGNYIYALKGGGISTAFYRYTISSNSWTTLTPMPGIGVHYGGNLAYDGGSFVYATLGRWDSTDFYRYSISSGVWLKVASTPASIYYGGDLIFDGGNHIFATRGYNTGLFYRYSLFDSWSNTSGSIAIACFDCHNSHGSSVSGTTTRYTSATTNGGILKDTTTGKGGYSVTYKPAAGGSAGTKNAYNPGAALCFDCHLNADGELSGKPWGYQSTYEASQAIHGYFDTPYFGPGTFGSQVKYPYKANTNHQGGHFGASSSMSTTPTHAIGGLCTPCHDPHGVSPSLGGSNQYAVPLLKGTWMTSPYGEDAAPLSVTEQHGPVTCPNNPSSSTCTGTTGWAGGSTPGYKIDQNTFANWDWNSPTRITESITLFGSLCLQCHAKSSIDPDTTSTWKSMDRIHESVKGWGSNTKHSYTCSKCHSPHSSRLPRLMVTNCLDYKHRGRVASTGSPANRSGWGQVSISQKGNGAGKFPAGGGTISSQGANRLNLTYGFGLQTCHGGSWPSGELWNNVSTW